MRKSILIAGFALSALFANAQLKVYSSGKVCTGSTSLTPYFSLHAYSTVAGVAAFGTSTTGNTGNISILNGSNYSYGVMGVVSGTGSSSGDVYGLGYSSSANSSFTNVLNWTSTAQVGIGMAGPAKLLQLGNNSDGEVIRIGRTDNTHTVGIGSTGFNSNLLFYASGSEKMRMDVSGNVGIGITSPSSKLDVAGSVRGDYGNSTVSYFGVAALGRIAFNGYAGIRHYSLTANTDYALIQDGNGNTYLNAKSGSRIYFRNSNTTDVMAMNGTGLYIGGMNSTTHKLELSADDAVKPNGGSWSVPSDIRLKKDTSAFNDGLTLVRKIRPINYKYNGLAGTPSDNENCIGIIAQEMQKIAPYTVKISHVELKGADAGAFTGQKTFLRMETTTDSTGTHTDPVYAADVLIFNPSSLMFVLINSVKQLDSTVTDLQTRLNSCCKAEKLNGAQESGENDMINIYNLELANNTVLFQNYPNPFGDGTTIKYFIPDNITNAQIVFFDDFGNKLREFKVEEKGMGQLNIAATNLSTGVYSYSLIVNGKVIDTKKMIKAE
ncbi:MAG: hypothetical protein EPN85_05820 [Bacteroidetes bacterium]|nr:MAG: hypothetical protein EPN85_05820 [Bacteroidota bacterium]